MRAEFYELSDRWKNVFVWRAEILLLDKASILEYRIQNEAFMDNVTLTIEETKED